MSARVTGAGHAVPAAIGQQALWDGFFEQHYGNNAMARRVWQSAGVRTRHGVVDPTVEDISGWGTAARM